METATPSYMELVQAATNDAAARIKETLKAPINPNDLEANLRFQALVHDEAAKRLAGEFGDLVQAIIHEMLEMERERYYLMLPQEFSSLAEWAKFTFARLVDDEVLTWDYISRFCNTVTDLLIPLDKSPIADETGEVLADAEMVIANAHQTSLKEMTYFYKSGNDEDRREIALKMARGDKPGTFKEIKDRVRQRVNTGAVGNSENPTPTVISKPKILTKQDSEGNWIISGTINDVDLKVFEAQMGWRFDFVLSA